MGVTKFLTGAAAAAALSVAAAAPAQAQSWDRYHDRNRGIDAGDIIAGVAVIGGIAAILGAFNRDGDRYGYDNRYRYRDDYRNAVNSCAYEAERYARGGRVTIVDIDRRSSSSYRVRGVIDAGYGYGSGSYGSYGRYDRYDRSRYNQQVQFSCTARSNGRVTNFDIDRRASRW